MKVTAEGSATPIDGRKTSMRAAARATPPPLPPKKVAARAAEAAQKA
jgi:hypothetical protein